VPKAVGDFIMLDLIRASGGIAVTVTDDQMIDAVREMGKATGVFAAPEGGATLAAAQALRAMGFFGEAETVVLFNTGTGLKYLEAFE
jgi:threonine synthase